MLGGAIGAGARFHLGNVLGRGGGFPWGTLAVNLLGCVLIALVAARVTDGPARLFLSVGLLGGFTTFSAFTAETAALIERGAFVPAAAYMLASVAGGLAAFLLGQALARPA